MNSLIHRIEELKNSEVKEMIDRRMDEFRSFKDKSDEDWFSEMCFCILTANSSAELGIRIQKKYGKMFLNSSESELAEVLRKEGHRFYSIRARWICEARKYRNIKRIISKYRSGKDAREWVVRNIKGLGYKEASHFLRNVGFEDVAILDRHILGVLLENELIKEFSSLTKKRYLKIEKTLEGISSRVGLSLGELDLYLWYLRTGKILK